MLPNQLMDLFTSIHLLDEYVIADIANLLEHKFLEKKGLLLNTGQTCKHIYFVQKGLLRSFYKDSEQETTTSFMKENNLIISGNNFFNQQPCTETIEALEDCELYYISFENLHVLYEKHRSFSLAGIYLLQQYYIQAEERFINLRQKDATTKYKCFKKNEPELNLRCSLKYIASYLGITNETLSRIRAKRI
ncbi:Crp/Fnr family transcriptional regulator [Chitinophagaceae bacterium LWZ2-11]